MSSPGYFGFGSPSSVADADGFYDSGFGSPEPPAWDPSVFVDLGFGDPNVGYDLPIFLSPSVAGEDIWYPDDGGIVCTVSSVAGSVWSLLGGTFRVKFRAQDATLYPKDQVGALAPGARTKTSLPADRFNLVPLADGRRLRFCMPPLPLGIYDVVVYYGSGYAQSIEILEAFRVVFRHLSREEWNIRSKFPEIWKGAGPRSEATEPMLEDVPGQWPHALLRALTRAVAEEAQLTSGKALTRITSTFQEPTLAVPSASIPAAPGICNVETTLGFTDSGSFFVGPKEFTYTGRTSTSFLGCLPIRVYDGLEMDVGTLITSSIHHWYPQT